MVDSLNKGNNMATKDTYKVTESEIQKNGLQGVSGNTLPNNSATENKLRFDQLPTLIAKKHNDALDYMQTAIDTNKELCDIADVEILDTLSTQMASDKAELKTIINTNKSTADAATKKLQENLTSINTMINNGTISTVKITYGVNAPSGGVDGDVYIQITD